MTEHKTLRQVLPVFTLTEVCGKDDQGAVKRVLPRKDVLTSEYYYRNIQLSRSEQFNINQMEMVLNPDGSPWAEACLYILSKIEDSYDYKGVISASNIASGLATFRQYLIDYDIDYLEFPQNKLQRPTYRYRTYLKSLIRSGQIAKSTGQRFMQSVISFYKWLSTERGFKPEYPMWKEEDKYIDFKDRFGFSKVKQVKSTNLSLPARKESPPDENIIADGGKLKPLSMDEQ